MSDSDAIATESAASTADAAEEDGTDEARAEDGAAAESPRPVESENLTARGWDGWPTAPTPGYLVPKMGDIPVSSTVHFQTVAMTSLGDDTSASAIWTKIRSPLLAALRRNAAKELVVERATYGALPEFPRVDVTDRVAALVSGNTLEILAPYDGFGDPAPGSDYQFRLRYRRKNTVSIITRRRSEGVSLPGRLEIERARYGDLPDGAVIDVTDRVASMIDDGALSVAAANANFTDPAPGVRKSLEVNYIIDGMRGAITVREGEALELPGDLTVLGAVFGVLPPGESTDVDYLDVTDVLRGLIDDGRLSVVADDLRFGRPTSTVEAQLHVDYLEDGVPGTATVARGETLTIGRRFPTDATSVYEAYFDPDPSSVRELARRMTDGGVKPTDIDPRSTDLTMEDELNLLIGIAPEDRLDPLAFAEPDAMDTPAEGVILFHEQGWYGRGLALGNLLHSVALAPGEVTQIAMTNWNHTTRGTDTESVSQDDSTAASDQQNRAVTEIQRSTLNEHTSGDSVGTSASLSASSGYSSTDVHAGVGWGSVHAGVSGSSRNSGSSSTVTTAVSHNNGDRDLSMDGNQQINAATQRHAEASRTRRAAVVREVAQSENETLTTRVLANYNHMHALSVMYFEVVEVFSLRTKVVDAERLIFLPFVVRDVEKLIPKYRAVLVDTALAAGDRVLADAIRYFVAEYDGDGRIEVDTTAIAAEHTRIDNEIDDVAARIATVDEDIAAVPKNSAKARSDIATALSTLDSRRVAIANEARIEEAASALFARFTVQQLQQRLAPVEQDIARQQRQLQAIEEADRAAIARLRQQRAEYQQIHDDLAARSRQLARSKAILEDAGTSSDTRPFHQHRLVLNQAVWLHLSPGEVLGLARRRHTFRGEPIFEQIDPAPVAVSGNYVGYRWRFADTNDSDAFKKRFVRPFTGDPDQDLASVQADVAVPTGGVFGEAVLGQAVSAEKIDLSRFWNWKDSPIPILPTSINPLSAATPSIQDMSTTPGKLDPTSARLDALAALPDPAGFQALAQTMQAQTFRDMSGQEMLKSLAEATTQAAASGEAHATDVASGNLKSGLDFISNLAEKAMAVAMAPETGGASLMGGLVDAEESGGSSVLGGVLNAKESEGKRDLLARLTGDATGGRHLPEFPKVPDEEPTREFPKVPDEEPSRAARELPERELEELEPE